MPTLQNVKVECFYVVEQKFKSQFLPYTPFTFFYSSEIDFLA